MNRQEKCYAVGYPGTEAKHDTGIVEQAVITKGKVTRLVSFLDNPGGRADQNPIAGRV